MKGMDGIGEPARLAHLLEQARGHPAAGRVRENLHGVKILMRVSGAFEADGDMGLFEPPPQALFAAPVERPRGSVFDAPRRKVCEAPRGLVTKRSVFDCSGGADHRRVRAIVSREIGADRIPAEPRNLLPCSEDRPPNRLIRKRGGVQQFEDEIVGRVFDRADFLQNNAFFAFELQAVEGAFGQNIGEDVECERNVPGQDMGVIGGMFGARRGVEIAADGLDLLGYVAPSAAACP